MHKEKARDKPEPSLMKFLNYNLFLLYHRSFELSTLQKNKGEHFCSPSFVLIICWIIDFIFQSIYHVGNSFRYWYSH